MESARRDAKDVTTALEPNDVERLFPGQIHQEEGSAATGCQQIVFLMRMQIELPCSALRVVGGRHSRAAVNHQVARVRGVHGDVEKTTDGVSRKRS